MMVFVITIGEYRYRNKKTAIDKLMAIFSTESYRIQLGYD